MRFTQFMFPHGRRQPVIIDMPPGIETKATELELAGWRFEIECFPDTQLINMDCCNNEEQLANRVCQNGPDVPVMVVELVEEAHKRWTERGATKCPRR